jgi:hypothetical protein
MERKGWGEGAPKGVGGGEAAGLQPQKIPENPKTKI